MSPRKLVVRQLNISSRKCAGGRSLKRLNKHAVAKVVELPRNLLLHPEFVFTYVCARTWGDKIKGQRYPITPEGAKTEWRRHRARSGVNDFRCHDIRHDVATKLLRETGNMKLVQKALNHSNIATTARYAGVMDDDVAAALERVTKSRKSPQNTPRPARRMRPNRLNLHGKTKLLTQRS
jgi:integrase